LRSRHFLYGQAEPAPGVLDLDWFDERGERLSPDDWNNPQGRALAMRRASVRDDGRIEAITLLLNGSTEPIAFTLPPPKSFNRRLLIDSAEPEAVERVIEGDGAVEVRAHSAVLLAADLSAADAPS
jgi:glycogen operon protein